MKKESSKYERSLAEQLVLEFFDQVWHPPHNLDAIDELMTEDYNIHSAGKTIEGREAFKSWVRSFQEVLLDAKTQSIDIFNNSEQNKVVSRWICSGRNNGIFDLPADGQEVSFTGIAIWTIKNNRLVECWVERSALELYQNLLSK